MNLLATLKNAFGARSLPLHLRRGRIGEREAKQYLRKMGLKFLACNFRSPRGEIDLIFRQKGQNPRQKLFAGNCGDCLVFVEVKTRSSEEWSRPAAAVNAEKRRLLSRCALDYLRLLKNPKVKIRFDIVEVLLDGEAVREIRHLPNTFHLSMPYRYG